MRIHARLLWGAAWLALAASVALGWLSARALRAAAAGALVARVRAEADLLAAALPRMRALDAQEIAVEAGRRLGLRVTLVDAHGAVLGDSTTDRAGVAAMGDHRDRDEIRQAAAAGAGESLRRSESTGVEYLYVARRVEGAEPIVFARLAVPASQLRAAPAGSLLPFLAPGAAAALLLAAAYLRARAAAARAGRLAAAVDGAAGAPRGELIACDGEDEIAALAAAVNRLKRSLEARIADLQEQQLLGASVIAEMREGLLVVGADRRILLANPAFRRIFRVEADPAGRLVAEVIRAPAVLAELNAVLDRGEEIDESSFHAPDSGRAFELHVTPLRSGPRVAGALILFFDITRLEALERVRRDFVANVSHELRTPLTSIKAFVETLVDAGVEDRENALGFLKIVRKHAGRMEELIDDLTDLSLIETGAIHLDLLEVDAREVAREVTQQVGHRHPGSAVEVLIDLPAPFPVRADRRRLEQALLNLVDNAVKFSRPGGEVRVRGERTAERVTITVEDDGIGIPADSLEKVFHRFYRVEGQRSREVGGTGLGLAIVKHLMRLHDGAVRVESELGRGSAFHLDFPAS